MFLENTTIPLQQTELQICGDGKRLFTIRLKNGSKIRGFYVTIRVFNVRLSALLHEGHEPGAETPDITG